MFDKNSPYLPTRKIGKNESKGEEIRIDNYLRQEWNHMVDRAVTEGVTEEELCQVKKKEITVPAQESIMKEGWKPDQFRKILQKAIGKLRGFIQFMKEIRNGEFDARGNPLIRHDLRFDVTGTTTGVGKRRKTIFRSTGSGSNETGLYFAEDEESRTEDLRH